MMDACSRWMLCLALLTASASVFSKDLHKELRKNNEAPKMSLLHPEHPPSVRAEDVAVLSAVGLPYTLGSDGRSVMNNLHDLMSVVSPKLISVLPDDSLQSSNLVNQAKHTATLLNGLGANDVESGWKSVFLFVPFHRQCACDEQVSITVQEVDEALQVLQSRIKKAIISVVLHFADSSRGHSGMCNCKSVPKTEGELRFVAAFYSHAMQEALKEKLWERAWYHRDDFTVQLRDRPLYLRHVYSPTSEENRDHKFAVQLWENFLRPTSQKRTEGKYLTKNSELLRSKTAKNHAERGTNIQVMGTEVNCEVTSPSETIPTSVHEVRPADIRVVATTGDSITAANGVAATSLLSVLIMYRGISWSIGGDQDISTITTLPNILRKFNPDLTGYSLETGFETEPDAFLNQAVPGAKADDMLGQAKVLVEMMKTDERIDFESDWKVITLFIGGNDLCAFCENTEYHSAENFALRIQQALDYLHLEVPRAIVNMVDTLYILPLRAMYQDPTLDCPTWLMQMLCGCVVDPVDGSQEVQDLDNVNRAYQKLVADLVASGRYDTRPDFTVVLQPFMQNLDIPVQDGHPDQTYFTPDCFHLSQKSHTLMARGLWNNMLERIGEKTTANGFDPDLKILCPSEESPFIFTSGNSRSQK